MYPRWLLLIRLGTGACYWKQLIILRGAYLHLEPVIIIFFFITYFESGSGSIILAHYQSGSGSRVLMTKNLQLGQKFNIFLIKIAIYLFLGLHKGRPSYGRSLQPSKRTFSSSKHEISIFVGLFTLRIRIHCPDWILIHSRSGSETLLTTLVSINPNLSVFKRCMACGCHEVHFERC